MIAASVCFLGSSGTEQGVKHLADCATTLSDRYFVSDHTLVYSVSNNARSFTTPSQNKPLLGEFTGSWVDILLERVHLTTQWPIVVSRPPVEFIEHDDTLYWDTTNDDRHDSYILTLTYQCEDKNEVLPDMKEQIEGLRSYAAWNSRGRFIVVLVQQRDCDSEVVVEALLTELWKWKIINVLVLVQKNNNVTDNLKIYSWFPYEPSSGACDQVKIVLLDTWVSNASLGFFEKNATLFHEKIPRKMDGCPLRVQLAHLPPYVVFQNNDGLPRDVPSVTGFDMDMIRTVAEVMNMSLKLVPLYDIYTWGSRINGTWTGLRGGLANDRADVALDAWSNNLEDHLLFQDTERYFTDRVTWYVPRAKPRPRWMSISRVFATNTWTILFFSIFGSAIVFWCLTNTHSHVTAAQHHRSIIKCISDFWAILLIIPVPQMPYTTSLRVFFMSWVMCSLSLNNIFQTFFTSYLIDPGLEHTVSSTSELVDSELDITLSVFLALFFDEKLLRDQNRRRVVNTPYECLQIVAKKSNVATMLSRNYVRSVGTEFLDQQNQFPLSPLKEDVLNNHIVMLLQKGSYFLDIINSIIIRLVEAGLPGKFLNDFFDTEQHRSVSKSLECLNSGYLTMTVSHLQSAYVLLFLGIGLSLFTFIVEILQGRWGRRRAGNTSGSKVTSK